MKIYFPYSGPNVPVEVMEEISEELEIRVEISYEGVSRLRKAAPNRKGLPHRKFNVRLFPNGESYRKSHRGRRTNSICWHGHRDFMIELFRMYDDATLRSAVAEYNGAQEFWNTFMNTQGRYFDGECKCYNE